LPFRLDAGGMKIASLTWCSAAITAALCVEEAVTMTRRPGSRSVTVERPRQKGWWGEPEADQLIEALESEPPAAREPSRRPVPSRIAHSITPVGRSLTPGQIEAIRVVMRLFVDDDLANGVDPRSTLLCNRCTTGRRAVGSVRYDRFVFCHECSVEFEVARARGLVESPAEFLERSVPRAVSA
jgi:hypothetical protein